MVEDFNGTVLNIISMKKMQLLLLIMMSCSVEVDIPTKYERRYSDLVKPNMYWFLSAINGDKITDDCRLDDQTIFQSSGEYLWVLAPVKCFANQLDTVFGTFILEEEEANYIYVTQSIGSFNFKDTLEIVTLNTLEMSLQDLKGENNYYFQHLSK